MSMGKAAGVVWFRGMSVKGFSRSINYIYSYRLSDSALSFLSHSCISSIGVFNVISINGSARNDSEYRLIE